MTQPNQGSRNAEIPSHAKACLWSNLLFAFYSLMLRRSQILAGWWGIIPNGSSLPRGCSGPHGTVSLCTGPEAPSTPSQTAETLARPYTPVPSLPPWTKLVNHWITSDNYRRDRHSPRFCKRCNADSLSLFILKQPNHIWLHASK